MGSLFSKPKVPDNSAQIAASKKSAQEAREKEAQAKESQKKTQEELIEGNKARRRRASQRFSLVLLEDEEDLLGV